MADDEFEPMVEEYRQLFTYVNTNAITTMAIPPAVITVATGLAIFSKDITPLFGLGIALAIFVMLVWLGYCHSMVNGIGLRLVELEQKLNRKLKRTDENGFSYHTWYIAQGSERLIGFNLYSMLLFVAFAGILSGALIHFWITMSTWHCSTLVRVLGVSIPAMLNLAAICNMAQSERKTRKLKEKILMRYKKIT